MEVTVVSVIIQKRIKKEETQAEIKEVMQYKLTERRITAIVTVVRGRLVSSTACLFCGTP